MLKIKCFVSKKGVKTIMLYADLGYTQKAISFDSALCAQLLDMPMSELMRACEDGRVYNL